MTWSFEDTPPWVHAETVILTVTALLAFVPAVLMWETLGRRIRVVFLVALAVSTLPVFVYRRFWSREYDLLHTVAWAIAAATVVAVEMAVFTLLLTLRFQPGDAVLFAFVVVVLVSYVLPGRLLP